MDMTRQPGPRATRGLAPGPALRSTAGTAIVPQSSKVSASAAAVAQMLDLAATMYSRELTPEESRFWKELLEPYPPAAIETAFKQHLGASEFFPKPSEIRLRVEGFMDALRKRQEQERSRLEQAEWERRRARGETFGWADFLRESSGMTTMKDIAPVDIETRRAELKKQARQLMQQESEG